MLNLALNKSINAKLATLTATPHNTINHYDVTKSCHSTILRKKILQQTNYNGDPKDALKFETLFKLLYNSIPCRGVLPKENFSVFTIAR